MATLTLGDHTFSVDALHPEALHLMKFLIEALSQAASEPGARGFDAKHIGIVADYLEMYAATVQVAHVSTTWVVKPSTAPASV
jgi:hypothetical protein